MLYGKICFYSENDSHPIISLDVRKTEHVRERTRGLLGHPEPGEQEALWITPCNAIHTFGMQYPLDLVYLDKHNRIKKLVENIKPRRISVSLFSRSVLELRAGLIRHFELTTKNKIQWIQHA